MEIKMWSAHSTPRTKVEDAKPSSTPTMDIARPWAAHGPEYEDRQLEKGFNYINSHMKYIIIFILLTLAMVYLVGKKAATYFLLATLAGQLLIPNGTGETITELFKG